MELNSHRIAIERKMENPYKRALTRVLLFCVIGTIFLRSSAIPCKTLLFVSIYCTFLLGITYLPPTRMWDNKTRLAFEERKKKAQFCLPPSTKPCQYCDFSLSYLIFLLTKMGEKAVPEKRKTKSKIV